MSAELLPRWQRLFIAWFLNRRLRKAKQPPACPSCGDWLERPHIREDILWDGVVDCPHCGHASALMSLYARETRSEEQKLAEDNPPVAPPAVTKITVEDTGAGRRWRVPAKGGCNGLLVFAALWLGFSGTMFTVVAVSDAPVGALIFMSVFILIGLGLLYGGLMSSRAWHTLELDAAELVHTRTFLGRQKRRAFPREGIQSVRMTVFYSQNYTPVYGIEITCGKRKMKFGSALSAEEKAWLCQDMREALGLEASPVSPAAEKEETLRQEDRAKKPVERMRIERGEGYAVVQAKPGPAGTVLLVIGCVMCAITGFMLWMAISNFIIDGPVDAPLFFAIPWFSFILFWCGGVSIGFFIGLAVLVTGLRLKRTHKMLHADASQLSVVTTIGQQTHEHSWPAAEVRELRVEAGARTNGVPMWHSVILLPDRVITYGLGREKSELERANAALSEALGLTGPAPEANH